MSAIYRRDGDAFVATGHARGPWDPGAQHGGAPVALLARAIEALDAPVPMGVARLTVEFLGSVPLGPVTVAAQVVRPGRRLQLAEAAMRAGGRDVLRARAVRLRREPVAVPEPRAAAPVAPPEAGERIPFPRGNGGEEEGFHRTGMEIRFVEGSFAERGPATAWFRLAMPLVEGEEPSALQRVAAAADFGNGASRELDWDEHLFVNTDLTIHLVREPVGDWVALRARTDLGPDGTGLATSTLHDRRGRIGAAAQSLFVGPRA